MRIICYLWATLLPVYMLLLIPLPVAADGGAPDLAYIAGAGAGVSVLDLIQQRISRTLTVPGDPRTLVLSADGNTLYLTQPTLGRVTALDTATGRTLCTAQVPGQPTTLVLALVSRDGSRLITASAHGICRERLLAADRTPVRDLALLAQLLGSQRLDSGAVSDPLGGENLFQVLERLRLQSPHFVSGAARFRAAANTHEWIAEAPE